MNFFQKAYLMTIGGDKVRDTMRSMLLFVADPAVLSLYSGQGKKEKMDFSKTKVKSIVYSKLSLMLLFIVHLCTPFSHIRSLPQEKEKHHSERAGFGTGGGFEGSPKVAWGPQA